MDRFCANQDLIFDYKSTLTGTDNRRFIYGSDIINFFYFHYFILHLVGADASSFARFVTTLFCFVSTTAARNMRVCFAGDSERNEGKLSALQH